jgi:hypothetical protein
MRTGFVLFFINGLEFQHGRYILGQGGTALWRGPCFLGPRLLAESAPTQPADLKTSKYLTTYSHYDQKAKISLQIPEKLQT